MANIDIITILNAGADTCFRKYSNPSYERPTRINDRGVWNKNVWMIGSPFSNVVSGQGTYNLHMKVRRGDVIRWWDAKVPQGAVDGRRYDLVQYKFLEGTGWDNYMGPYHESKGAKQYLANVDDGFDTDEPNFSMYRIDVNYVTATVENAPPSSGVTIHYHICIARVNRDIDEGPEDGLDGTYRYDPYITFLPG